MNEMWAIQVLCLFPGASRVTRARFRPELPRRTPKSYLGRFPAGQDLVFLFTASSTMQDVGDKTVRSIQKNNTEISTSLKRRIEDIAGRGIALELVRGAIETQRFGESCFAVAKAPNSIPEELEGGFSANYLEANSADRLVKGRWEYVGGRSALALPQCNFHVQTTNFSLDFPTGRAFPGYAVILDMSLTFQSVAPASKAEDICLLCGETAGESIVEFEEIAAKLSPYSLYAPPSLSISDNDALDGADESSLFYMYEPESRTRRLVRIERGPTTPVSPEPRPTPAAVRNSISITVSPTLGLPTHNATLGVPVKIVDVKTGASLWDCGRAWLLVQFGVEKVLRLSNMVSLPAELRREIRRRCLHAGGFVHPAARPAGPSILTSSVFPASLENGIDNVCAGDEEAHFTDSSSLDAAKTSLQELGLQGLLMQSTASSSGVENFSITVTVECETDDPELLMDLGSEKNVVASDGSRAQVVGSSSKRIYWTAAFRLPHDYRRGSGKHRNSETDRWRSVAVSIDPPSVDGGGGGGSGVVVRICFFQKLSL